MRKMLSAQVSIPHGFSSLENAQRWESSLENAERALSQLWLQRTIYALEELLNGPPLAKLDLYCSSELPGLELIAWVDVDGTQRELGSLLIQLFKSKVDSIGLTNSGEKLELIRLRCREIEQWSRQKPTLIEQAKSLGPQSERDPIILRPGMDWRQIALELGAMESIALMERAQLSETSRSGSAGAGAKRV